MKGLKRFLSTILAFAICFSFCCSAISETADAEEKAKEIFEGLAKCYNSALSYLESVHGLNERYGEKHDERHYSLWFLSVMDALDNLDVYTKLARYAMEVRPEADHSDLNNFIYETIFLPVYEKYNRINETDNGIISSLIIVNDIIWRDEKGPEHLEEQKQALRQFRKDYPDYELFSDLQNMYKATLNIVDYTYNEKTLSTSLSAFVSKIQEFRDVKRSLQGDFDLYFDWPDSMYPGSQETYRDFYVSYWAEIQALKESEKKLKKKPNRKPVDL